MPKTICQPHRWERIRSGAMKGWWHCVICGARKANR